MHAIMEVSLGEDGGDNMTDEQRAHDFALKMMEIYFQLNKQQFTSQNGDETVIEINKLFEFYDQNYIRAMQIYFHHEEPL